MSTGLDIDAFMVHKNITRVYIPKTVTVFQGDTFVFCKKLEEIHFEEGFKNANLSYYTFYGSGIKSFRFPIGSTLWYDFFSYSEIRNVYIYDMTSYQKDDMFRFCYKDLNILVPINYPYSSFGNRPVQKVLPYYAVARHSCLIHEDFLKFTNLIPLIMLILLY